MKVDPLDESFILASCSEEQTLHEKTTSCGVCVSVGDIIEDYEENTLRYAMIQHLCMSFQRLLK